MAKSAEFAAAAAAAQAAVALVVVGVVVGGAVGVATGDLEGAVANFTACACKAAKADVVDVLVTIGAVDINA